MNKLRRTLHSFLAILLAFVSLYVIIPSNSFAAVWKPMKIIDFHILNGTVYVGTLLSSGTCVDGMKVVYKDDKGKVLDVIKLGIIGDLVPRVAKVNSPKYPFITVHLLGVDSKHPGCGGYPVVGVGPFLKINTSEVRDELSKAVLWSTSKVELDPVSNSDTPLVGPLISLLASQNKPCDGCEEIGKMELVVGQFGNSSDSAFLPLTGIGGYRVVSRRADSLVVVKHFETSTFNWSELYLVDTNGWKLIGEDAGDHGNFIALTRDMKSFLSVQNAGHVSEKYRFPTDVLKISFNQSSDTARTTLFSGKKSPGGFICGLVNQRDDKAAFFTHINSSSTQLYKVDLATSKVIKVGKILSNFCPEDIDSQGRLIGAIKNSPNQSVATSIFRIPTASLSEVEEIKMGKFTIRPYTGASIISVGNYLVVLVSEMASGLKVFDPATMSQPIFIETPFLYYLSSLPDKWVLNSYLPPIKR